MPADIVPAIWRDAEPLIRQALRHSDGRYGTTDIRQCLLNGEMHLWLVMEGAIKATVITQTLQFPRKKIGLIFLTAGNDMAGWIHLLKDIERCMKAQGCAAVELYGRPGWQKVLPDYQRDKIVLRKEI